MNIDDNLRSTSFHEASHAVAAQHLTGLPATISIERISRAGAAWHRGRCAYAVPQSRDDAVLVALSGAVGEVLSGPKRGNLGDALLTPMLAAISRSDAIGAGCFSRRDMSDCLALVRRLWPAIEARAQLEIHAFHSGNPSNARLLDEV